MKIKYLSVPILALLLLLVGCSNPSSDREEDNEKKEDKQEQKADKNEDKEKDDQEDQDSDSDEDSDADEMTDDVSMDVTANTQEVADQAYDANYRGEAGYDATNESAAPANDNYDDEKYQEYLSVKENSDGLREAERNNGVPEGAGGGGSSWSYVNENESYDEWVDRTTREKAAAGFSDDDYSSGY